MVVFAYVHRREVLFWYNFIQPNIYKKEILKGYIKKKI